jgi:hypothetical protein
MITADNATPRDRYCFSRRPSATRLVLAGEGRGSWLTRSPRPPVATGPCQSPPANHDLYFEPPLGTYPLGLPVPRSFRVARQDSYKSGEMPAPGFE